MGLPRSSRAKLFAHKALYDVEHTDGLFLQAVKESVAVHSLFCSPYAAVLENQAFALDCLEEMGDLHRLPPLPTSFLKSHGLFTIPFEQLPFKAESSGTSGVSSRMGLDWESAWLALRMVLRTFSHYRLLSPLPTNYIVLGYQPNRKNRMGAAQTAFATTLAAPAVHREYALKYTPDGYRLDMEGLHRALLRYEKQGFPVRFMGFPAYLLFLLESLEEAGIQLQLHPRSKIFLAGGWKQFLARQTDKGELYEKARRVLGIGERNCRDFFGAVEHPIVYCDCPNHHFHVPVYSRVIVRDVKTLAPAPNGTPGLLNLITPLVGSMPLTSVITDDLAVLHDGAECGCGVRSPWFELLGRAGLGAIKTCAANAADFLPNIRL